MYHLLQILGFTAADHQRVLGSLFQPEWDRQELVEAYIRFGLLSPPEVGVFFRSEVYDGLADEKLVEAALQQVTLAQIWATPGTKLEHLHLARLYATTGQLVSPDRRLLEAPTFATAVDRHPTLQAASLDVVGPSMEGIRSLLQIYMVYRLARIYVTGMELEIEALGDVATERMAEVGLQSWTAPPFDLSNEDELTGLSGLEYVAQRVVESPIWTVEAWKAQPTAPVPALKEHLLRTSVLPDSLVLVLTP